MKMAPFLSSLFSPHYSVLRRLLLLCVLTFATFFFLQSDTVSRMTGVRSLLPSGFNALPLLLIVLFCLYFFYRTRGQSGKKSLPLPGVFQIVISLMLLWGTIVFAWWMTHPPFWVEYAWQTFIQTREGTGVALLAALLYASLLLPPMIAYVFLLFPAAFLYRHRALLLGGLLLLGAYLFASVAEIFYHQLTVQTALHLVASLLHVLPGEVVLHASRWEIGYGPYLAIVGPLCSAFSVFLLFIGMFAFMSSQNRPENSPWVRGALVLLGGLILMFAANIVRIAGLVWLGSIAPAFATHLIHGAGSGLFLLLIGWAYLRLTLPVKPNK